MLLSLAFYSSFLAILLVVAADKYQAYDNDYYVVQGCIGSLASFAPLFCPHTGTPVAAAKAAKCLCSNKAGLATLANCTYFYGDNSKSRLDSHLIEYCQGLSVNITEEEVHKVLDSYRDLGYITAKKGGTYNGSDPLATPAKTYKTYYLSVKERYDNVTRGYNYGIGLLGYWAGVLLIAGLFHWCKCMIPDSLGKSGISIAVRKLVTLPATFGKKHLQPATLGPLPLGLVPTRLESLVLLGFFILHVVFLSIRYKHIEGNLVFVTKQAEISRYVGDRSAELLSFTTPLTILFAGRNNFLIWLTGLKQSTYMVYHRWCARILVLTLIVHTGAFVSQSVALGKLQSRLKADYFRWGIVGFSFSLALCCQGYYYIRTHFYEVFYLFHLTFGVFFLAGAWRHAASQVHQQWFIAATAIFAFDKTVSLFRVLFFGCRKAQITLATEELFTITVAKPKYWKAYPGAYAYVYFMSPSCFWQSHPLTVTETETGEL